MSKAMAQIQNWKAYEKNIAGCTSCPRLRKHCQKIAQTKRRAFLNETYWGRPVAGFGDRHAHLVIAGLAPAAHGANRTGRVFTGDRSGLWLYRALHKAGFSSQSRSEHRNDGLKLQDAFVTAVVKCAPPLNKPSRHEIATCSTFLNWEIQKLKCARVYLALGKIAFDQTWNLLKTDGQASGPRPRFGHGSVIKLDSGRWLLSSYHPSQQNTFTGRLTEPMFDNIFSIAKLQLLSSHQFPKYPPNAELLHKL